jgi:hypothetical protein
MMVVLVFGTATLAQSVRTIDSETSSAPDEGKPGSQTILLGNSDLRDVELKRTERLLRLWQYQFQLLEQPAFLVASTGGTTQTIPNPNYWLQQHSIILTFSELFPRTTNLPQLVQAAYDNYSFDPTKPRPTVRLNPELCRSGNTLACLAGGGSGWSSFSRRLLSGASVTFSVAQRDEVQQGVVVSNLTASQGWGWNGQVDFNPASLLITSANWKNAFSVLGKGPDEVKRTIAVDTDSAEYKCFVQKQIEQEWNLAACETAFSRPRLSPSNQQGTWVRVAAAVIPTFQLKVLSQFDFIKQGGILTETPLLQRSLKNLTFTWDLRRLKPATTDKLTIATLYEQAKRSTTDDSKQRDNSSASKLCLLKSGTSRSYVSVAWDSTVSACERLAIDLASDYYAVGCAKDKSGSYGDFIKLHEEFLESAKPSSNCGW